MKPWRAFIIAVLGRSSRWRGRAPEVGITQSVNPCRGMDPDGVGQTTVVRLEGKLGGVGDAVKARMDCVVAITLR